MNVAIGPKGTDYGSFQERIQFKQHGDWCRNHPGYAGGCPIAR